MKPIIRWIRAVWHRLFFRNEVSPQPVQPTRTRMTVGIVCHLLRPEDLVALREMGVRHVRLSLYPTGIGSEWFDVAAENNLDVIGVSYRDPSLWEADKQRWPNVHWQYGNEIEHLAVEPTTPGALCPGIRTDTNRDAIEKYVERMPTGQILAFHSYGQPLTLAATRRLQAVSGFDRTLWCTETGQMGGTQQELHDTLKILEDAGVERTYVYALYSDIGYTITPAQRVAIKSWIDMQS
jgi:hypothetical protein